MIVITLFADHKINVSENLRFVTDTAETENITVVGKGEKNAGYKLLFLFSKGFRKKLSES